MFFLSYRADKSYADKSFPTVRAPAYPTAVVIPTSEFSGHKKVAIADWNLDNRIFRSLLRIRVREGLRITVGIGTAYNARDKTRGSKNGVDESKNKTDCVALCILTFLEIL